MVVSLVAQVDDIRKVASFLDLFGWSCSVSEDNVLRRWSHDEHCYPRIIFFPMMWCSSSSR